LADNTVIGRLGSEWPEAAPGSKHGPCHTHRSVRDELSPDLSGRQVRAVQVSGLGN